MNDGLIELLNKTEEILLTLMRQYKSDQYDLIAEAIDNIRKVRDAIRARDDLAQRGDG